MHRTCTAKAYSRHRICHSDEPDVVRVIVFVHVQVATSGDWCLDEQAVLLGPLIDFLTGPRTWHWRLSCEEQVRNHPEEITAPTLVQRPAAPRLNCPDACPIVRLARDL